MKLVVGDKKIMGEYETLCAFHTPHTDIAYNFGVDIKELREWVKKTYGQDASLVYQRFMVKGNAILNKSALRLADKNPFMNIWLRKQWLKEKDPDKNPIGDENDVEDLTPLSELLK